MTRFRTRDGQAIGLLGMARDERVLRVMALELFGEAESLEQEQVYFELCSDALVAVAHLVAQRTRVRAKHRHIVVMRQLNRLRRLHPRLGPRAVEWYFWRFVYEAPGATQ